MLGLEKSINDISRRAKETGDEIARSFADQALRVIAEWKKSNADLVNMAFDRLDDQSKNLFNELNNIAVRMEKGEAVAFLDVQRSLITAGRALGKFASDEAQVAFYWPSIVLPDGEKMINVRVIGNALANANPTVTIAEKDVPVKKHSDNEIGFDLPRETLQKSDGETTATNYVIRYEVSASKWYNPFSWWSNEPRERDIEIRTLPKVPGSASVVFRVRNETWEYLDIVPDDKPVILGGRGRDATYSAGYTITPELREQGWILDKTKQKSAKWDDHNGDGNGGSSCVGFDENSFTDVSFGFKIQHGHVTDAFGKKSDAYQNCRIWEIFVKRPRVEDVDADPITKPLSWMEPTVVPVPDNSIGSTTTVSLYTGRKYPITDTDRVPYDLFEVKQSGNKILFQPREQRGF